MARGVWAVWLGFAAAAAWGARLPAPVELSTGWQLQDAGKAPEGGAAISGAAYPAQGWMKAVVPGTVLTSLVSDGAYPEPLYGENNRTIPETLNKSPWWYRTTVAVPREYNGREIALNLDGANYAAEVWVNGTQVGALRGAFLRGRFPITRLVKPGETAIVAVKVSPQPHPGVPHEHTIANGLGLNGGVTAVDGPTFLSTIGWDWLPAIRDRDTGLWRRVYLSASGPVRVEDPYVTTDLPLPRTDSADVKVSAAVENLTDKPQTGTLEGSFGAQTFAQKVTIAPHAKQVVAFDPQHVLNPQLWWPNGYGPQNLQQLHLHFVEHGSDSDALDTQFGIRKITYGGLDALTISVNGVKVFIRGGDWGLDEGLKRIPRERLEAEIRMHQLANLNMIRNWVGQSTGEDFYALCDKYGILVWDEFFQPNPSDGPDPDDLPTYLANVRDKLLQFRNHPSIALWCARNEGPPPPEIDAELRKMLPELDPVRLYQPSSTDGRGVISHGPYYWREPQAYYVYDAPFKTETGSVSVPTLESVHAMMPEKDWEQINDDWAEHDLAKGAQHGDLYPYVLAGRYGRVANLADFVRKAQLMNWEAYRAMYEGRNARLFAPATGILTWMSAPAQPSFVWQLYGYDLDPNSSLYAVKSAAEPVHVQMNEATGKLEVVNNRPEPVSGTVHVSILNLGPGREGSGASVLEQDLPANAPAASVAELDAVPAPEKASLVYFIKLELRGADGNVLSRNLYWKAKAAQGDDLSPLNTMKVVQLTGSVARREENGRLLLDVTLRNPGQTLALMTHLQLRRGAGGERVLPAYFSDNYLSLAPGESRTVQVDAAIADLKGKEPMITVDGWNVDVAPSEGLQANVNAQVDHWPATGLPMITAGLAGKP